MWKQRAPARRLPSQRLAERSRIDRHQHQIGSAGEMLRGGLGDLRCGGGRYEAVAPVDARATEALRAFGLSTGRRVANLVDGGHRNTGFQARTYREADN